jgi:hypothetical protein
LRFDEERVESRKEKVPSENLSIGKGVEKLVNGLENDGSIDDEHVKLRLQAIKK